MTFVHSIPLQKFKDVLLASRIYNKRFNMHQFEKNFNGNATSWCMLFDGNRQCVAAAAVVEGHGPGSQATSISQLQCLASGHGYGKTLLNMLKDYYGSVWLMADPSVRGDALLKFYRDSDFDFVEHVLPADESKYGVDTHFFSARDAFYGVDWHRFLVQHYGNEQTSTPLVESKQSMQKLIDEVVNAYSNVFGIDLSYMEFVVDTQPICIDGTPCHEYAPDECGGDWTCHGYIRLNPDMKSVMKKYGLSWNSDADVQDFTKVIVAHELAHEVWHNIASEQFKQDTLRKARSSCFTTVYLKTVEAEQLDQEMFCEYLAHQVVQQRKEMPFPKEDASSLSKRRHIVTHRVSNDIYQYNEGDIVETPWHIPYKVTKKRQINSIEDSPYIGCLTHQQIEFLKDFDQIAVLELDAVYDPPYTLEQIKQNYSEDIYKELSSCPIHRWRAQTGIELIHKEPTKEELDRIWKNWQLMPQKLKCLSDAKSIQLFGCTNAEHYSQLKSKYQNKQQI